MKVSVLGAGLVAGFMVAGCKAPGKSKEPSRDIRDWTLAEIEAELQRNDDVLASEGIMVAAASVPTAPATTPRVTPGVEHAVEEQEAVDDEGGGDATAPISVEPEPEPAPELSYDDASAPAAAEPDHAYEDEAYEAEESVASERRRGSKRSSSSRRESPPSRCERVCDLAEATCNLEAQICELALRHPDEPRYTQACERAEQQCVAATRACDRCDD